MTGQDLETMNAAQWHLDDDARCEDPSCGTSVDLEPDRTGGASEGMVPGEDTSGTDLSDEYEPDDAVPPDVAPDGDSEDQDGS